MKISAKIIKVVYIGICMVAITAHAAYIRPSTYEEVKIVGKDTVYLFGSEDLKIADNVKETVLSRDEMSEDQENILRPKKSKTYQLNEVDRMPCFPGGESAIYAFLAQHLTYPAEAQQLDIEGRVIVQFVISNEGYVKDVRVVKGKHPALDNEAVRVVNLMPRWTPAQYRGVNVDCHFILPVTFKLH